MTRQKSKFFKSVEPEHKDPMTWISLHSYVMKLMLSSSDRLKVIIKMPSTVQDIQDWAYFWGPQSLYVSSLKFICRPLEDLSKGIPLLMAFVDTLPEDYPGVLIEPTTDTSLLVQDLGGYLSYSYPRDHFCRQSVAGWLKYIPEGYSSLYVDELISCKSF